MPPFNNLKSLQALQAELNNLSSGTVKNKVNRIQRTRKMPRVNAPSSAFNDFIRQNNLMRAERNRNMYNTALSRVRNRANLNKKFVRQERSRKLVNNGRNTANYNGSVKINYDPKVAQYYNNNNRYNRALSTIRRRAKFVRQEGTKKLLP
jgi:hypothetical protein